MFRLADGRPDAGVRQQGGQLGGAEVADPDGAHQALVHQRLQRRPRLPQRRLHRWAPRRARWPVDLRRSIVSLPNFPITTDRGLNLLLVLDTS